MSGSLFSLPAYAQMTCVVGTSAESVVGVEIVCWHVSRRSLLHQLNFTVLTGVSGICLIFILRPSVRSDAGGIHLAADRHISVYDGVEMRTVKEDTQQTCHFQNYESRTAV